MPLEKQPLISVIVCTYNPRRDHFERTLEALRVQTLDVSQWDLLIVDNKSDTPLTPEGLVDWHPYGRLVREEEKGLAHARLRGIAETAGDLLVFVDDDNLLAPDYLEEAIRITEEFPFLGAFGAGVIEPEFEVEPARHMKDYLELLALRRIEKPVWGNKKTYTNCPAGAGAVLQRKVADSYQSRADRWIGLVRSVGSTENLGKEDLDLAYSAVDMGMGIGIFPTLRVTHLIPAGRVQEDYLVNLQRNYSFGSCLMAYLHEGAVPLRSRPPRLQLLRALLAMFEGQYFDYRMKKAYAQGATLGRIAIDRLMQGEKQAATNRRQAM